MPAKSKSRDLEVTDLQKEASKISKEEWREYTKTVWSIANVSDEEHPAVFPLEIPSRLIKLFSFSNEVVLDPFAGIGTTADAALALDRRAICVEQNPEYIERMESSRRSLNGQTSAYQIVNGDARDLSFLDDDSVGVAITSPPYWNKADYGDGENNIGRIETYPSFIESLRPAYKEAFRVLAPGRKLCIVTANVNQHTERGLLTFPIATDTVALLREVGFVLVNELIWNKDGTGGKWGSWGSQRPIFGSYPYPPNFLFKNVHEYIVVAAKPPTRKSQGKTALPYEWLMEQE
jgi:DNA modification methylase